MEWIGVLLVPLPWLSLPVRADTMRLVAREDEGVAGLEEVGSSGTIASGRVGRLDTLMGMQGQRRDWVRQGRQAGHADGGAGAGRGGVRQGGHM